MAEPITASALLASAASSWLIKKGLDSTSTWLWRLLSRSDFKKQLDTAWATSADLKAVSDPPPTFDHGRLTPERWNVILNAVLTNNDKLLGEFLFAEQLIDLPWKNSNALKPFGEIGRCAAQVTIQVASRAIATDDKLRGAFQVYVSQTFSATNASILAELEQIRERVESSSAQITQHEFVSDQRHVELVSLVKGTNARLDEVLINRDGLTDLLRENLQLEKQLTEHLDEKGKAIWQGIQDELQSANFRQAQKKPVEFKLWLDGDGLKASPRIRGRGYILLAHLALLTSDGSLPATEGVDRAETAFLQAIGILGVQLEPEDAARVARFRAKLQAIRRQYDSALELVSNLDDADSMSTRLAILIDAERFDEAYTQIQNREIDPRWAVEAIIVNCSTGHEHEAIEIMQSPAVRGDESLGDRCRLAVGRTTVGNAQEEYLGRGTVLMSPLSKSDGKSAILAMVLANLDPAVMRIEGRGRPINGVESDILALAYACQRALGNIQQARKLLTVLASSEPIHEDYARSVFRGDVPYSPAISDRLRKDYPNNFSKQLLALDMDWHYGEPLNGVAATLEEMATRYTSPAQKEELTHVAFEFATSKGELDEQEQSTLDNLCSHDDAAKNYLAVYRHISNGKLDEASAILAQFEPDDFVAMQFDAEIKLKKGDMTGDAAVLAELGKAMPEPYFLRKAAFIYRREGYKGQAIRLLEDSLIFDPDHQQALADLAMLRVSSGDYLSASELFDRLAAIIPDSLESHLNQAKCLAKAGEVDEAITILDLLSTSADTPLVVYYSKAQLLKDTNRAREALELLKQHQTGGWDDPAFVLTYMDVAYGANSDKDASDAFQRLLVLRNEHELARELMQPRPKEDVISLIEQHQHTLKLMCDEMQKGRMPWLLAERLNNNPPIWGLFVRTQPMPWVSEQTVPWCSYSVYASNGYSVLIDDDGTRRVLPIKYPPKNSKIVADLSALLTLDKLGLLERCLTFVDRIILPSSYLTTILGDGAGLLARQPSQVEEKKVICAAVQTGRLRVLSDEDAGQCQLVDEYASDKQTAISASQLLDELEKRPGTENHGTDKPSAIDLTRGLVVTLGTLQHFVRENQFELVVQFPEVAVSRSDYQSAQDAIANDDARKETRESHLRLWEKLKGAAKVEFVPVLDLRREDDEDTTEPNEDRILAFEAMALAEQLDVPLFADDRVCQAFRLNQKPELHWAAFGTAEVVRGLKESGTITQREATSALLQLVKWRYRFLVLSPAEIRAVYDEHGLAGLREIAWYLHSCMRDRGLFGGLEEADLRLPMAFRVYQDWERHVTGFIGSLWIDNSIDIDEAKRITEWAVTEFLPSIPINLSGMEPRLAMFGPSTVIMQLLFELFPQQNYDRAHQALYCVARHLGLTKEELLKLAGGVICGQDQQDPGDRIDVAIRARMAKQLLPPPPAEIEPRTGVILKMADVLRIDLPNQMPDPVLQAISNPTDAARLSELEEPALLLRESETERYIVELHTALLNPAQVVRCAVLDELDRKLATNEKLCTDRTRRLIADSQPVARSDGQDYLRECLRIHDSLSGDLLYNLSLFKQAMSNGADESAIELVNRLLRPTADGLACIEEQPLFSLIDGEEGLEHRLESCIQPADISKALQDYFEFCGFVPLAGKLSCGSLIKAWRSLHPEISITWQQLATWADSKEGVLAQYHICQAIVENQDLITEADKPDFNSRLNSIVHSDHPETVIDSWELRQRLARYYAQYLSCDFPGGSTERISIGAWWLADKLATALEAGTTKCLEQTFNHISQILDANEELWLLVQPGGEPSVLFSASMQHRHLWSESLAGEMVSSIADREFVALLPEAIRNLTFAALGGAVLSHASFGQIGKLRYSFELDVLPFVKVFRQAMQDTQAVSKLDQIIAMSERLRSAQEVELSLAELPELDEETARVVSFAVQKSAFAGGAPSEKLWQLVTDTTWMKRLAAIQWDEAFSRFCEALIRIQSTGVSEDWRILLPHIFANVAADVVNNKPRIAALVGYSIVSSIAGRSTSAVDRLVAHSEHYQIQDVLRYWYSRLDQIIRFAKPLAAARLRPVKQSLSAITPLMLSTAAETLPSLESADSDAASDDS